MVITELIVATIDHVFVRDTVVNFILYRNLNDFISYTVCVHVNKICEKFGGCKKSFLWLGKKVNKKINGGDAYMATMPTNLAWTTGWC